ncbi:rhombosortase [Shewanella sp. KT0246]|uniref:rhombosortase n=1 Tax=Shewanella sp. KT0246 TaxID=2815912 RepID=UPI001BBAA480|nr:rhombosortase [Shewanella sp. KT0246]GIU53209.1 rhombosortase [Shewanella sp. KT0246]
MARSSRSSASTYYFAILISIASCVMFFMSLTPLGANNIDNILSYRYDNIQAGEYWRIITGNLLHTNLWHLLMNLAGFWVILFLHETHYKSQASQFIALFISLCILEGLGLYWFFPELKGYVGLSGLLHGLFTFGSLLDIRKGYFSGYLLLLGVFVKVGYEMYFGASESVSAIINARVATESHFIGVISGLLCGLVWIPLIRFIKQQNRSAQ